MNIWYRTSLYCGLTPLCLGILIYFSWYATGEHWLESAGLFNIVLGLCLFATGLISLSVYMYQAKQRQVSGYLIRSLLPLFILVINFPVAGAIIDSVDYIKSTSIINIKNNSNLNITDFLLTENDKTYRINAIPANGEVSKEFHFQYEGSVYYSFTFKGEKHKGVMFGYVTGGLSFTSSMLISGNGQVSVDEFINSNGKL